MDAKFLRPGESHSGSNSSKQPTSRLQKRAPMTLQLDAEKAHKGISLMEDLGGACTPIPLLSPLLVSPRPLWEISTQSAPSLGGSGGDNDFGSKSAPASPTPTSPPEGWRHPALSVARVEPPSAPPFLGFHF